ncbi:restriction endonuclease subunit S [Shewanella basaltis]|uniref:restriction endonuclease subunit S n=1 Tax=Shewanella basaltis TaxID=472183 RepID=UPI003AAAA0ED
MSTLEQHIPEGYQKTEIGIIPKSWESLYLGDLAEIRMCKRVLSWQTRKSGPIPFFKIGTFGGKPDAFISNNLYQDFKKKFSFPRKGDVLISAAGTIGKTVVYDGEDAYFQDSNIVWLEIDEQRLINEYLYHYYQIIKWASTEGSTISRLYNGIIKASPITLPSLKEQTAIANALSDVDALLSELENLIAKKQAIKTATMQQLLTGKTRLPQFAFYSDINSTEDAVEGKRKGTKPSELGEIPEDWDVKNIGSLCTIFGRIGFRGYTKADIVSEENGVISLSPSNIKYGKINYTNCTYITLAKYHESPEIKIFNNDILLVKTGSTFGKVAIVKNLPREATLNPQVVVLKNLKCDPDYLASMMQFKLIQDQINDTIVGGAIPTLSQKEVANYVLPAPSIDEQTAIATIVSDMDNEIQTLEQRLSKTRQIKQGMMQELLTGKTRLPFDTN